MRWLSILKNVCLFFSRFDWQTQTYVKLWNTTRKYVHRCANFISFSIRNDRREKLWRWRKIRYKSNFDFLLWRVKVKQTKKQTNKGHLKSMNAKQPFFGYHLYFKIVSHGEFVESLYMKHMTVNHWMPCSLNVQPDFYDLRQILMRRAFSFLLRIKIESSSFLSFPCKNIDQVFQQQMFHFDRNEQVH